MLAKTPEVVFLKLYFYFGSIDLVKEIGGTAWSMTEGDEAVIAY